MQLIYISPLLIYFPRLISGVETQPWLAVIVAAFGIATGSNRKVPIAFFVLSATFLLWISIMSAVGSLPGATELALILVGPLILFGAIGFEAAPPSRLVMAIIALFFATAAMTETVFPNTYADIATVILDRASVSDGHRGVSLFAPEPTYAAITVTYFLLLSWWSGLRWGFRHRWIEFIFALCLLGTASTYAVLLLMALVFGQWPRASLIFLAAGVLLAPALQIVALDNDESVRGVVAISRLFSTDLNNFLPSVSEIDSSLGSRLITNVASLSTPLYYPLGLGLDCGSVPLAFNAAGYDFAFDNVVLQTVIYEGCLKPQSYSASIALGLGLMALAFLLLLLLLLRFVQGKLPHPLWRPPLAVAAVVLVVQGQLTNPIPWLLVFMAMRPIRNISLAKVPTSPSFPIYQAAK